MAAQVVAANLWQIGAKPCLFRNCLSVCVFVCFCRLERTPDRSCELLRRCFSLETPQRRYVQWLWLCYLQNADVCLIDPLQEVQTNLLSSHPLNSQSLISSSSSLHRNSDRIREKLHHDRVEPVRSASAPQHEKELYDCFLIPLFACSQLLCLLTAAYSRPSYVCKILANPTADDEQCVLASPEKSIGFVMQLNERLSTSHTIFHADPGGCA